MIFVQIIQFCFVFVQNLFQTFELLSASLHRARMLINDLTALSSHDLVRMITVHADQQNCPALTIVVSDQKFLTRFPRMLLC
jgi:hypothetical protein